ncbi:MAG: hypothetical protein A3G08_00490 [Candidatus Magasanikbacteria bacterium RIFCSPLOWO2_12_FULL_47_9b]|nr:MAG: hypothetical protein A3I74_00020 [Candidatus Magasanikbacteria bacterium RIFCSPLOWO2_02_FULL_47_16]OGH80297.1 MAG: hypothetical protein A3C10_03855 [Candidatus Magasanikbacteria bacterium RIFCSPHIGHO2_02_FULL_48_18]OGH82264.1 MAG: hypothetical protein A3G08_00490 [Candidatus Magasanikbacteria bacterium RIFCSPLOWO2_12_FULL_47_9b]
MFSPQSGSQAVSASQSAPESVGELKRTRCEVWTRVMGYHRPVSHFNTGKKAEHYSRKHFQECVVMNQQFIEQYSAE